MKRKLFASAVFLFLLAAALLWTDRRLSFKYGDGIYNFKKYYEQEPGTVDVLVLGSSHAFENINTGVLWDEKGIASFALGGSIQPMWNTYYFLKEALKTQKPKLIVLETYLVYQYEDYSEEDSRIVKNTSGMRWSPDRIRNLLVSVPPGRLQDFILPYVRYHSRWNDLSEADFLEDQGYRYYADWKGFGNNMDRLPAEASPYIQSEEREEIPAKSALWYEKTLGLAAEHGIPVLCILAPYPNVTEWQQAVFNSAKDLAEAKGVTYIDCNRILGETGIDFSEDIADDAGHLNDAGNTKFSSWLGSYIAEHYPEVPDRRGDPAFASWQRNADYIRAAARDHYLSETRTAEELLPYLKSEDFLVIAALSDPSVREEQGLGSLLQALAIPPESGIGTLVWENFGRVLYASGDGPGLFETREQEHDIRVGNDAEGVSITVDRTEYARASHGVDVVLIDRVTGELADAFYVEADAPGEVRR